MRRADIKILTPLLKTPLAWPVFLLIFGLFGLAISCQSYQSIRQDSTSVSFEPVQATVEESYSRINPNLQDIVTVEFSYKDSKRQPRRAYFDYTSPKVQNDKINWPMGKQFTVFVDPNNGKEWSFSQGPKMTDKIVFGIGSFLFITGAIGFYPLILWLFRTSKGSPTPQQSPYQTVQPPDSTADHEPTEEELRNLDTVEDD